jgi:RNA polymerase sigma-70 factor (ECF subfamily)
MSQYAQGHDAAFEIVYDAVAPRLEGYLRRHVREAARVEDIIQQTFMHMHHKRGTFNLGAEVLPWACTIARNFMIDSARKTQRETSRDLGGDHEKLASNLVSALATGEQLIQARQTREMLIAAYEGLSDAQREAFTLVKIDGLSVAQAAQVLGTTPNGIKLRIHKAMLALRASVGQDGQDGKDGQDGEDGEPDGDPDPPGGTCPPAPATLGGA